VTEKIEIHTKLHEYIYAITWNDNSTQIAVTLSSGELAIITIASMEMVRFQAHEQSCTYIHWINNSEQLISSGQDGMLCLWDATSLLPVRQIIADGKRGTTWIEKTVYNPIHNQLAGIVGKQIIVWDTRTFDVVFSHTLPKTAFDIEFSADGTTLTAVYYGGAALFTLYPHTDILVMPYPASFISCALSPNKKYLAAGTGDNKIHFWQLPYIPEQDLEMAGYFAKIRTMSWSTDSKYLATPSYDSLIVWDVHTKGSPQGTRPAILQEHYGKITQVAFQPNGQYLASADEAGYILIWDYPLSQEVITTFQLPKGEITALQWAKHHNRLAVGNEKGNLLVWKVS